MQVSVSAQQRFFTFVDLTLSQTGASFHTCRCVLTRICEMHPPQTRSTRGMRAIQAGRQETVLAQTRPFAVRRA